MASPFEIIALAQTIAGVGSKIYKFFSSLKDAPQEIRDLCVELELLRTVVVRIGITSSSALKRSTSSNKSLGFDTIFACLKLCEAELNPLWLAISPLRSDRGLEWGKVMEKTRKSITWVVRSDEIEKATRRLEGVKQTLVLGISLSGIEADAEIAAGLSSVEAQIEANSALVVKQAEESQATILAHLQQLEHRLLHRVEDLSHVAEIQHEEGHLRISQLADDFAPIAAVVDSKHTPDSDVYNGTNTTLATRPPDTHGQLGSDPRDGVDQAPTNQAGVATRVDNHDQPYPAKDLEPLLGPDFGQFLGDELTGQDLSKLMNKIQEASLKSAKSSGMSKLNRLMSSLDKNPGVFEAFYGVESPYQNLVMGGMKVVLQAAMQVNTYFEAVLDALEDMSDALQMCEREYRLYPEPRLLQLFQELCREALRSAASAMEALKTRPGIRRALVSTEQQVSKMKDTSVRIKSLSEKVRREVEYLHRRELREAHERIRDLDRKQDEALRMLKEQQRISIGLQEEQKLLSMVADHQKVLQLLQQLLARHG